MPEIAAPSNCSLTVLVFLFPHRLASGYSYYAISFGVEELSGDLYLNMFLLSAVEIPAQAVTWFFNNW